MRIWLSIIVIAVSIAVSIIAVAVAHILRHLRLRLCPFLSLVLALELQSYFVVAVDAALSPAQTVDRVRLRICVGVGDVQARAAAAVRHQLICMIDVHAQRVGVCASQINGVRQRVRGRRSLRQIDGARMRHRVRGRWSLHCVEKIVLTLHSHRHLEITVVAVSRLCG